MKDKCIAFVCFGTSDESFYNNGLLPFLKEGKEFYGENYTYHMIFTSNRILEKIKRESLNIDAISIEEISNISCNELIVIPLYLINGSEFLKAKENIRKAFKGNITFNPPLLDGGEDEVVDTLLNMKEEEKALVLIGHGSKGSYNLPYDRLKERLGKINKDIFFTTLNEENELKDFLEGYKKRTGKGVKVVPFLMTLGNHFYTDINETIYKKIEDMGFCVEIVEKSIGMNEEIRRLFFR